MKKNIDLSALAPGGFRHRHDRRGGLSAINAARDQPCLFKKHDDHAHQNTPGQQS